MGTFVASLRAIGDTQALAATVEVEDGWLNIAAGDNDIGSWPLSDIHLEPIPTGYRMAVEGEQILIEMKEVDSFSEAVRLGKKRKLWPKGKKKSASVTANAPEPVPDPEPTTPVTVTRTEPRPEPRPEPSVAMPPQNQAATKPKRSAGFTEKGLAFVDGTLHKANKRLGPYLPEWVFTRIMFAVAFIALILMIVLPGVVSTFLLVAGALIIVFGAIAYSDPMLASRWLPGRTQPPHVLVFGVAILMLGVLLGVIANL